MANENGIEVRKLADLLHKQDSVDLREVVYRAVSETHDRIAALEAWRDEWCRPPTAPEEVPVTRAQAEAHAEEIAALTRRAEVAEAIHRDGDAELRLCADERDALKREVERMRAVVEAAVRWSHTPICGNCHDGGLVRALQEHERTATAPATKRKGPLFEWSEEQRRGLVKGARVVWHHDSSRGRPVTIRHVTLREDGANEKWGQERIEANEGGAQPLWIPLLIECDPSTLEPPKKQDEPNPCATCGKAIGNRVFTICDDCWPKHGPASMEPKQDERWTEAEVKGAGRAWEESSSLRAALTAADELRERRRNGGGPT